MKPMSKRINWLDVSRGIAFFMVIYSHLEYCNADIMRFFSPVFLTTFFFISGYLSKEGHSFLFVLENRTRTLLLPFLILGSVMILMSQLFSLQEQIPLLESIKGLLLQNGNNELLWFIAALYIYSLMFYWVEKICKSANDFLIVGGGLFVLNAVYEYWLKLPSIPWHINFAGFACFYMALGKVYKNKEQYIDNVITNKRLLLITISYVLVICIWDLHISFHGSPFLVDALFVTIVGILLCVIISKRFLNNCRFLLFVGANTLFYFAFHGKVYSLLQLLSHKFTSSYCINKTCLSDIAIGGIIVVMDALILIIPAMAVNKYIPQILGRGFKLWKTSV